MARIVLHIDMDAFFAAIEERDNPQFHGQPIVVGADPMGGRGRGVVSTANYEARKFGIHSAMPITWAYRANPKAIFLPVDMKRYTAVSRNIMAILRKYGDSMEQMSVDEAYLEIKSKFQNPKSKTNSNAQNSNHKKAEKIAKKIKKKIWKKEKLTCSIGIGPSKMIAKIASGENKPDGLTTVRPEDVQKFLDPRPVDDIPGVGPKTTSVLNKMGILTIAQLRQIDKKELIEKFGKNGNGMWEMANGRDDRAVEEVRVVKSVGRHVTFARDTKDSRLITKTVFDLLEEIFEELQERGLAGRTLTVIVRYAWFETYTSQESVDHPITIKEARKLALKLLLPYFNGKMMRLVGVRVSGI